MLKSKLSCAICFSSLLSTYLVLEMYILFPSFLVHTFPAEYFTGGDECLRSFVAGSR